MSVKIKNYDFEGAYTYVSSLDKKSGVYAVLCSLNSKLNVIDIGEAEDVRDRLENHDRKDCWNNKCKNGTLKYAAYYCDEKSRMRIEKELRDYYGNDNLCGDQ